MNRRSISRGSKLAGTAILSALFAGCAVGPDYHTPRTNSPPAYGEAHSGPTTMPSAAIDLTKWWNTFNDPELDSLIHRSIDGNFDLLTAEARVREARASLGAQVANLFPIADLSAQATRGQTSKTLGRSATPTDTGFTANPAFSSLGGGGGTNHLYQAGFDSTWEIDLFGGTRRSIEQAAATLESQVNARRNTLVTLTAEVARDYVQLRGVQKQLALTYSNLKTQQDSLDLTRSRFNAGLNNALAVAQAQAQVATTAAQIPSLEISIKQTIHAMSILLGQEPMALAAELGKDAPIPPSPSEIPVGLPSELLRRRPDVLQAENLLHASTANIGVVVSELFPRFSLTGSFGQESAHIGLIARGDSNFWSWGPTMSWRVFDTGQLINDVRVANAQQAEALYNYKKTVLQSISDVEDALVAYAQDQNRTKALADAVIADQRAVDLSNELYTRGLGDFLNVLTAEQGLFSAQTNLAVSQTNVSSDLIQLYKALGGGWDENHEEKFHKNEDPKQKIVMD